LYCYFYYIFFFVPPQKETGYGKKDGANQRSRGGEHLTVYSHITATLYILYGLTHSISDDIYCGRGSWVVFGRYTFFERPSKCEFDGPYKQTATVLLHIIVCTSDRRDVISMHIRNIKTSRNSVNHGTKKYAKKNCFHLLAEAYLYNILKCYSSCYILKLL